MGKGWRLLSLLRLTESLRSGFGICRRLFSKNLGAEDVDITLPLPCILRQTGLDAGVLQELLAIPAVFGCHLREEHPAITPLDDVNAMFTDLDLLDGSNLFQRRQHRNIEVEIGQIITLHRVKRGSRVAAET